jgi:hypothetical protein
LTVCLNTDFGIVEGGVRIFACYNSCNGWVRSVSSSRMGDISTLTSFDNERILHFNIIS